MVITLLKCLSVEGSHVCSSYVSRISVASILCVLNVKCEVMWEGQVLQFSRQGHLQHVEPMEHR